MLRSSRCGQLKALAPAAPVNLEVDLIARYVEWMLGASQGVR